MSEEKFTFFWKGPLSQWYPSIIHTPDFSYSCAEQYMMDRKSLHFGDIESSNQIRATTSPREQKRLGRLVKGFDVNEWSKVARDIVYQGNYLKFSQHSDLMKLLLLTNDTTLVEASPFDKIWGIGLEMTDPRAMKRETWLGLNWLGETLTKLRNDFSNTTPFTTTKD